MKEIDEDKEENEEEGKGAVLLVIANRRVACSVLPLLYAFSFYSSPLFSSVFFCSSFSLLFISILSCSSPFIL